MKGRILTEKQIAEFAAYLKSEEKSENTVEKYIRDVRAFAAYAGNAEITKETVITYKNNLLSKNYAARSVNSMIASINSLLSFLGWSDLKVKTIKLQRQIYCPEEKELTKAEYMRLVNTAKQKGNERLNLLIQTICGTGIRVSELPYQLKGVENDPSQFIYDLNVYINYLQMKHQSDIILLQLPQEGMFRVYNNLPFGFGVKPYLVSQAVDVDYSIIVSGVEIYDSEIYKKISECFENRYGFAIDAVVVSERAIDYSLSLQNSEMTYKAVPDEAVDSCVEELLTGKTDILYCRKHEKNLGKKIAEHCIDRLSQNTAQF